MQPRPSPSRGRSPNDHPRNCRQHAHEQHPRHAGHRRSTFDTAAQSPAGRQPPRQNSHSAAPATTRSAQPQAPARTMPGNSTARCTPRQSTAAPKNSAATHKGSSASSLPAQARRSRAETHTIRPLAETPRPVPPTPGRPPPQSTAPSIHAHTESLKSGSRNHQRKRDERPHADHLQHVEQHRRAQADAPLKISGCARDKRWKGT